MSTTTELPSWDEVQTWAPARLHAYAEELKDNRGLHSGDFWECPACGLIARIENRR